MEGVLAALLGKLFGGKSAPVVSTSGVDSTLPSTEAPPVAYAPAEGSTFKDLVADGVASVTKAGLTKLTAPLLGKASQ